jgi:2-polyprenyl-3-methyl-5-hydroxy-6-metoxy-1,4-benzoquinol methylase
MIASSEQPEINSFVEKFKGLTSAAFDLQGYPAFYCDHLLSFLDYYCAIYKRIIDIAVRETKKPVNELSVLDYGAGNGFLGMFAKHYGFNKVWMCDTSETFLEAAKKTASVTKIDIEDFILGDIGTVNDYFKKKEAGPDLLLATDVIEHIYDLDSFFACLRQINPDLVCTFTTAASPYNYYKMRQFRKLQYEDELIGYVNLSEEELNRKGFVPLSYYEQRKKIIQAHFPSLSDGLVQQLAKNTRGKRKDDIVKSIEDFLSSGQTITPYKNPYWVCDPETGSWTERILPMDAYQKLFKENGFNLSVYNGFYNEHSKKGAKALIVKFLNRQINKHPRIGKYAAPFIVLLGTSKTKS